MLSDEVHFLVESLDACHVGLCIIGKLDLLTAAHSLGSPVEIAHIDGTSDFACYSMETGLPTLHGLACAFRCKCKMYDLLCLHLLDYAESHIASSLSVNRDSSHLAEKPSERTDEQLSLYHAVWLSAYRHVIKV